MEEILGKKAALVTHVGYKIDKVPVLANKLLPLNVVLLATLFISFLISPSSVFTLPF
jgi:hypothetical protein